MKLSLITPIYRESEYFPRFIERLEGQTNKNFEIVFVVDTNLENVLTYVEKAKVKLDVPVKVVYNSKRSGRFNAIKQGSKIADGEYSIILSTSNSFDENMVKDALAACEAKAADIIEFRARIKDPIKYDGKLRKNFNKAVSIKENKSVVAFAFPLEFNKIFKTELLKNVFKLKDSSKQYNGRYSVELVLKALAIAETYATVDKKIVRSKRSVGSSFNPLKMLREWNDLLKMDEFAEFHQELQYNQYFFSTVVLLGIIGTTKNKVLQTKFETEIKKDFDDNFFGTNKYYLTVNKETEALKANRIKLSAKLYTKFKNDKSK